jgi:hypothetical protein
LGIPHIATIKRSLVPDYVIYKFAPTQYLGEAARLQDITSYIERKKNVIRMSAQEVIAVSVANVAAVSRTIYSNDESSSS